MPLSPAADEPTAFPATAPKYQRTYGHRRLSSSRHASIHSRPWFSLNNDSTAYGEDDEDQEEVGDEWHGNHVSDSDSNDDNNTNNNNGTSIDHEDVGHHSSDNKCESLQQLSPRRATTVTARNHHLRDPKAFTSSSPLVPDVESSAWTNRRESVSPSSSDQDESHADSPVPSSPAPARAGATTALDTGISTATTTTLKHIFPRKPFSLSQQPNPTVPLQVQRHQATQRLAAAWQAICDKYERQVADANAAGHDFLDDEIDLETCQIVVDHGVVRSQKSAPFGSLTATMRRHSEDAMEEEGPKDESGNNTVNKSNGNDDGDGDIEIQRRRERSRQQRQLRRARVRELEGAHRQSVSEDEDIIARAHPTHMTALNGHLRDDSRSASDFNDDGDEEDNLVQDTEDQHDEDEVKDVEEAVSSFDNLLDSACPQLKFARFTDDDFDSLLSSPTAYSKRQTWKTEQPLRRLIAKEYVFEQRIRQRQIQGEEQSESEGRDGDSGDDSEESEEDVEEDEEEEAVGEYNDIYYGDRELHHHDQQQGDLQHEGGDSLEEGDGSGGSSEQEDEYEEETELTHSDHLSYLSPHHDHCSQDEDESIPILADTRLAHRSSPDRIQISRSTSMTTPKTHRLLWSEARSRSGSPSLSSSASPSPSPPASPLAKIKSGKTRPGPSFPARQPQGDGTNTTATVLFPKLPLERRVRRRTSLLSRSRAEQMLSSPPSTSTSADMVFRPSTSKLASRLLARRERPRLPRATFSSMGAIYHTADSPTSWGSHRRSSGEDVNSGATAVAPSSRKRSYTAAIELDGIDPYDDDSWDQSYGLSQGDRGHHVDEDGVVALSGSATTPRRALAKLLSYATISSPIASTGLSTLHPPAPSSAPTPPPPPLLPPPPLEQPPVWKKPDGWQKPKVVTAIEQDEVDPYDDESWTRWQESQL
ncbi:hypothetical protein DFQ27_008645 [Actinomortierella ambigua]|uniref:Uncharacterized protein n=1 Tax=Actinomortierella ambigua TaxID=1343610 RepID=A0A9P6PS20_9FUNG|nr:hypothetical protein DFQ27_008645 [Actinomortierella ambigua]